jgi:ABC-2 type transport system ATP-binding protein
VLDEPTVGLDPKQIVAIRELIRELGRQRTLLLSTHILPEVELLCHRVLIIDRGRIVDQGTPRELRERWRASAQLEVTIKEAPAEAGAILVSLDGVAKVHPDRSVEGRYRLECEEGRDLREEVFRAAVDRGWVLLELAERKVTLEDVFVRLTTRDLAAEAAPAAGDGDGAAEPAGDEEVES